MKASIAEWLHDKGKKALKQPSWVIPMMGVISLIPFLIWLGIVVSDVANGKTMMAAIGNATSAGFIFLGMINSLITVLWYERRHYYEIIQAQEKRIKELEK
jgi:hypothetical protein